MYVFSNDMTHDLGVDFKDTTQLCRDSVAFWSVTHLRTHKSGDLAAPRAENFYPGKQNSMAVLSASIRL